ncbi:MAG: PQQ-dependent dehydrogenase, methanol/ethanol family [Pseudomonadota bacterium]
MRITALANVAFLIMLPLGISATTIVDDELLTKEDTGAHWAGYGRTYSQQRHSPLANINVDNVNQLGVNWFLDLPTDRSLTGTPLVVDGIIYFNGSFNVVRAVDARTGKVVWEYDPKVVDHSGPRSRIFWDWNRGIAYWKGKIFNATIDGRMIAIDAKTGKEVWTQQTFDPNQALFITGAPTVFRDKVIIGNGGTEWSAARGFVVAYDTETGEEAWKFYTVPGNPQDGFENNAMKMAAKTWTGEWWKYGGGGTVWHAMTYDPEYNHLYIGTGNGSPWNRKIRSPDGGDNLFLCSIVALDADTGRYRWHYQTTPGETWDYNSNMDIMLVDLPVKDQIVKAILHAPKNGFFYLINRSNGRLLSAKEYVKVDWATGIDMKTGRPIERAGARYEDGEELVWPSPFGGHNWHAMSYNPGTGLVYMPILEMPGLFNDQHIDVQAWESPYWNFDPGVAFGADHVPPDAGTGALRAWDPVAQKTRWEVPLPGVWNPGTLTTAGDLVFQGRADGTFYAYNAETGEALWSMDLGHGVSAPPVTYTVDGQQHIALLVGWGGAGAATPGFLGGQHGWEYGKHKRRLITFAIGGDTRLPKQPPPSLPQPLAAPNFEIDHRVADSGAEVYTQWCMMCHGAGAGSGGYAPDLRASPVMTNIDALEPIVFGGALRQRGMPEFNNLSKQDIVAVQHYVRRQANNDIAAATQTAKR